MDTKVKEKGIKKVIIRKTELNLTNRSQASSQNQSYQNSRQTSEVKGQKSGDSTKLAKAIMPRSLGNKVTKTFKTLKQEIMESQQRSRQGSSSRNDSIIEKRSAKPQKPSAHTVSKGHVTNSLPLSKRKHTSDSIQYDNHSSQDRNQHQRERSSSNHIAVNYNHIIKPVKINSPHNQAPEKLFSPMHVGSIKHTFENFISVNKQHLPLSSDQSILREEYYPQPQILTIQKASNSQEFNKDLIDIEDQQEQPHPNEYQIQNQSSIFQEMKESYFDQPLTMEVKPAQSLEKASVFTYKDIQLIRMISEVVNQEYDKSEFMTELQRFVRSYEMNHPPKYKVNKFSEKKRSKDHYAQHTQVVKQQRQLVKDFQLLSTQSMDNTGENVNQESDNFMTHQRQTSEQELLSLPMKYLDTEKNEASKVSNDMKSKRRSVLLIDNLMNGVYDELFRYKFDNAVDEYDQTHSILSANIIEGFRNIVNPQSDDFKIGIALVLLLSVTDTSIQLNNDRSTLMSNKWEYIRKYLSSSLIPFNMKILKDKILENTVKKKLFLNIQKYLNVNPMNLKNSYTLIMYNFAFQATRLCYLVRQAQSKKNTNSRSTLNSRQSSKSRGQQESKAKLETHEDIQYEEQINLNLTSSIRQAYYPLLQHQELDQEQNSVNEGYRNDSYSLHQTDISQKKVTFKEGDETIYTLMTNSNEKKSHQRENSNPIKRNTSPIGQQYSVDRTSIGDESFRRVSKDRNDIQFKLSKFLGDKYQTVQDEAKKKIIIHSKKTTTKTQREL